MLRHLRIGLAAIALLGAVGCGIEPTTISDTGGQLRDLRVSSPPRDTQLTPEQQARQLLYRVSLGWQQNQNVSCELVTFFRKDDGTTSSSRNEYRFAKPNRCSLVVTQSQTPGVTGTKLVWNGGKDVAIKTKFVGFWIKTSLELMDSRLRDDRGWRIDETAIERMYATLLHPQARSRILGHGQLGGRPVAIVEVISPLRLKPATRDVFTIYTDRFIPAVREMYQGQTLIFRCQFVNIRLNTQQEPNAYNLKD